jgi:adenylate cyclase
LLPASIVRSFDALCEQLGVEKIKAIGDSYMAASGSDGAASNGAVAVGRLALAMLKGVDRQPPLKALERQAARMAPRKYGNRR